MEKKKSYEELEYENEIMRYAFDKIQQGVYITNNRGEIVVYNLSAAETEGFDRDNVLFHKEQEVYGHLKDYNFITDYSDKVRETKVPIVDDYYEYNLGYGKKTALIMSLYPYMKDGEVEGVCTIGRNINQIKDFLVTTLEYNNRRKRKRDGKVNGTRYFFDDIIGKSAAMKRMVERAKIFAKSDSPLMIYGETGTGKELVAQSIHNGSIYLDGPFVSVNCAAIPETLLESTLFGTTKGSFTGAVDKPGLFELAEGGTLFLDEINSMPLSLQPKLLRAIQEKAIRRVGGEKEISVNCRLISAVNRSPEYILEQGIIRDDLFFRLATIELKIPPLRERKEDIDYLVYSFIDKYNARFDRSVEGISPLLYSSLLEYDWPGNIRELENMVESAMNLVSVHDHILRVEHLSDYFHDKFSGMHRVTVDDNASLSMKERLQDFERKLLKESLERNDYNIAKVAEEFDMTRQNVYLRLKKLGITIGNKKFVKS